MTIALIQIMRSDAGWSWMVEFDDPYLGRSGTAETREAADAAVRAIVEEGK